jgi:curved DNA-binding protein CbpA
MRRHHPDTRDVAGAGPEPSAPSPEPLRRPAPEALQQVMDAYELLRDPVRRAEHDRRREAPAPATAPTPVPVRQSSRVRGDLPIRAGPVRWHHR